MGNRETQKHFFKMKGALAFFLSVVLAVGMMPTLVPTQTAHAETGSEAGVSNDAATEIAQLLAAGNYVEGQVVVAVRSDAADTQDWFADRATPKAGEVLAQTSAQAYVTATRESLDASAQDDTISVIVIESDELSTEEMLTALWNDERVLSVEPNYLMSLSSETTGSSDVAASAAASYAQSSASTASPSSSSSAASSGSSPSATSSSSSPSETASSSSSATAGSVSTALSTSSPSTTTGLTVQSSEGFTADPADIADVPNYQWGLKNDGAVLDDGCYYDGFDINSPNWNTQAENAVGVVATLDTGVDVNHPDLKNVLVDDMRVYNPAGGAHGINLSTYGTTTDLTDTIGHGTHVAGIIASEWNGYGTSGVANGVKLVAIKTGNEAGEVSIAQMARAYNYLSVAVDNGLNLVAVNNSWGDRQVSKMASLIVTQLGEKGVVSIFASGNNSTNSDIDAAFPSSFKDNPYAIVVDGSSRIGESIFNFGQSTTDVLAPGGGILSTWSEDTSSASAAYYSETDGNPISADAFDTASGTVAAYSAYDDTTRTASKPITRALSSEFHYDAGSSLAIPSDSLADFGAGESGQENYGFYLKIPANSQTPSYLDFKSMVSSALGTTTIIKKTYFATEATGSSSSGNAVTWTMGSRQEFGIEDMLMTPGHWSNSSFDLAYSLPESQQYIIDDQGCLTVKVVLGARGLSKADLSTVYLDTLAAGSAIAPYRYLSGTSMAAPMVTGSAAVAAKAQGIGDSQPAQSERAELAKNRVVWLKAHVNQYDGRFLSLCTTGGQIDLSVADTVTLPVIASAVLMSDSDPLQVEITGSGFGQGASANDTVTLAGKQATVVSWSDERIIIEVPDGVTAGVLPVTVTTAAGSCTEAFTLEIPSKDNKPLFEKDIALPDGFSPTSMDNALVGMGSELYVLPQDQYGASYQSIAEDQTSYEHGSYQTLWRYDEATESWSQCANLPKRLDTLSATAYEDKIVVCGSVIDLTTKTASSALYAYDSAVDSWTEYDDSNVPYAAAIANADGQLMLVGGGTEFAASLAGTQMKAAETDNVKTLDLATGSVESVGTLATPCLAPVVAYHGGSLYISQGLAISSTSVSLVAGMQTMSASASGWKGADISDQLPLVKSTSADAAKTLRGNFGMAATDDGVMISGVIAYTDDTWSTFANADTYLQTSADTAFSDFGKRADRAQLFYATSATTDEWLYTMASNVYDDRMLVLKATQVKSHTDDGQDSTDTGQAGGLAKTGDELPALPLAVAAGCALTLAVAARARRRRSGIG